MSLNNVDSSSGELVATGHDGSAVSLPILQEEHVLSENISIADTADTLLAEDIISQGDLVVIEKIDTTEHDFILGEVTKSPGTVVQKSRNDMSANVQNGHTVYADSVFNGQEIWEAFTTITNTYWRAESWQPSMTWESPVPVTITYYGIASNWTSNRPKSWIMYGWDEDLSDWVALDEQINFTAWGAAGTLITFNVSAPKTYTKYKIWFYSCETTYTGLRYIRFYGYEDFYESDTTAVTQGEIPLIVKKVLVEGDTDFSSITNTSAKYEYTSISEATVADTLVTSSPIVDGDNLVIIKDDDTIHELVASGIVPGVLLERYRYQTSATTPDISTASDSYRPAYYGFDGRVGLNTGWVSNNNTGVKWLKLELEVPKAFTNKIGLYNDTGSGNDFNYAIFQGSNDNVSWDNLVSCVNTLPETEDFAYIEFPFTNTVEYKYYRLYLDGSNPAYTSIPNTELFIESTAYSMDTTAITAGEIPSRVFTVDSKVSFDDGTGFTYPNELDNDYLVSGASLTNTRQYDDIAVNARSIETKVELKSIDDKCTEVSANLWKIP